MSEIENLKRIACAIIDSCRNELQQISSEIWNRPELAFNEEHAHSVLTDFLENHGFQVLLLNITLIIYFKINM